MNKKDYIIFSSIDWEVHHQLHHQLTLSLAKDNSRILFIQNIGVRPLNLNDTSRVLKRIKDRFFSTKGFKQINNNISLLVPLIFPFPFTKFFININTYILKKSIFNWVTKSNFNDPIIITFLPNPIIVNLFKNEFKNNLKIYYCANHMSKGSKQAKPLENWEKKLFNLSNLIFTISKLTYLRAKKFNKEIYNFPPAVDYENIVNNKKILTFKGLKKNICYIGAIGNVIDLELLDHSIKNLKNFNFIFIGPILTNVDNLKKYNNVFFLGQLDHNETISYLKSMYIGIIPYKKNEFTDNVYCCKLNEYLACGLPVISTNIYEVEIFSKENNNIISIANDKNDFVNKINNVDLNYNKLDKNLFIKVAKENSWQRRFKSISNIIDNNLISFDKNKIISSSIFFKYYQKAKKKIILSLSIPLLLLFITFYSPLFWFLGNILSVQTPISHSQAIVVFSGDGYSDYINTGYQKRALDSKKFLDKKMANKIILSSGKDQTIHEVRLLRSFLLSEGVDVNQIFIFEEYPSSTYENVLMVGRYLDRININDIIFITAPYHTLRSSLIWKSNFPNINIKIPKVIDSPSTDIKWISQFSDIKVIIYEYLAIIYNWYKNRL